MSKIAIITDTHWGARNDNPALLANMQKFYDRVFFPTLDKHKITRVLHGGDYVDRRKHLNIATAHAIHTTYRQPMTERGIVEDVILGNHDIYYKQDTAINAVGELYRDADPSLLTIHEGPAEIMIDGLKMLLLPWMCDANHNDTMRFINKSNARVVLGHLEIDGFQMYRGMPSHGGLSPTFFDRFDLVMSGHYHHKSEKGPIHYLGAPYPMNWSDYDDPRGFHLFDTKTLELTHVPNPYSLFAALVYDDTTMTAKGISKLIKTIKSEDSPYRDAFVKVIVKAKTHPEWYDQILTALDTVNPQDVLALDDSLMKAMMENTSTAQVDLDTLVVIREFVDTLTWNGDKAELMNYLQTLYHQALEASTSLRLS